MSTPNLDVQQVTISVQVVGLFFYRTSILVILIFFSSAIGNDAGGVPADVIGAMKRVSIDGNRPNDDNGPSDAPTNQRRKETNSHSQEEYVFVL